MNTVMPAEEFVPSKMGSMGNARYMLIRQCNFPHKYTNDEELFSGDDDRYRQWYPEHCKEVCQKYFKKYGYEQGLLRKTDEQIFEFLVNFLNPAEDGGNEKFVGIKWTGFRILCTITLSGYSVFTFQLFAKDPDSKTEVYSGHDNVPNVKYSEHAYDMPVLQDYENGN